MARTNTRPCCDLTGGAVFIHLTGLQRGISQIIDMVGKEICGVQVIIKGFDCAVIVTGPAPLFKDGGIGGLALHVADHGSDHDIVKLVHQFVAGFKRDAAAAVPKGYRPLALSDSVWK